MKDTARYIRSKVKRQTDRQGGKTDRSCESGGGHEQRDTKSYRSNEAGKQIWTISDMERDSKRKVGSGTENWREKCRHKV